METQIIPLGQLHDSPTNPRQRFDPLKMKELTASVKEHGILHPILARPRALNGSGPDPEQHYEIVSGHRRTRAARAVKLESIPANVREMTDIEVMECQLIELEQSEDIHPLEEAQAFQRLIDAGRDVATIAKSIAKSESHVYQQLKMLELIPEARTAFLNGRITKAHAVPIARLQPTEQLGALLFTLAGTDMTYSDAKAHKTILTGDEPYRASKRQLDSWIADNCHLDLSAVLFAVADAMLIEKAGACTTCPKNTGVNRMLFDDLPAVRAAELKRGESFCTDPGCYHAKEKAHLVQLTAEAKEKDPEAVQVSAQYQQKPVKGIVALDDWREAKPKSCKHARTGIVALSGWKDKQRELGETLTICTEKKCKTHWGAKEIHGPSNPDIARYQEDQKQEKLKTQAIRAARTEAVKILLRTTGQQQTRAFFRLLAVSCAERMEYDALKIAVKLMGWGPKDGKAAASFDWLKAAKTRLQNDPGILGPWFVLCMTAPDLARPGAAYATLAELAKAAKVDLKKLEREAMKPKQKPPKSTEPAAVPNVEIIEQGPTTAIVYGREGLKALGLREALKPKTKTEKINHVKKIADTKTQAKRRKPAKMAATDRRTSKEKRPAGPPQKKAGAKLRA